MLVRGQCRARLDGTRTWCYWVSIEQYLLVLGGTGLVQGSTRWYLDNDMVVLGQKRSILVGTDAWQYATSMPEDVAWASRRDLLLCADTEEM